MLCPVETVDRLDLTILFEGVFVEQSGASTKVGHNELARDIFMLNSTDTCKAKKGAISQLYDSPGHRGTHTGDQGSSSRC